MMCFKTIVLLSAVACLITAEKRSLKERIFNCKLIPLKKHHSIFDSVIPSIEHSLPVNSAVPIDYTVPTLEIEPVPTPLPDVPQQEVQYPPQQEAQYPLQPEAQYPATQQEGQLPVTPQQEVLSPPQQEVQNPPQPEVQTPPQQQLLYPPQHEGQRPSQYYVAQNPPSNEGLYPPQHNGQYYPPQNEGLYYLPSNYQGLANYNVPYNYPVYGQNVLRSVKSLGGQMYTTHQRPYRINMLIPQPIPYYNNPHAYGLYATPQYNYVPQAPKIPKALVKST